MTQKLKTTAYILALIFLNTIASAQTVTSVNVLSPPSMTEGNTYSITVSYTCSSLTADPLTNQVFEYNVGNGWIGTTSFGPDCPCPISPITTCTTPSFTVDTTGAISPLTVKISGTIGIVNPFLISPQYPISGISSGSCVADMFCNAAGGETCSNCEVDCGPCPVVTCPDGKCGGGETEASCPADCTGFPTGGLKPITINSVETCPEGPASGKLQKNTEYTMRLQFTTATPLEDLKAYYCLSPLPYPYGSEGICKDGTNICLLTNQLACRAGDCNPENCSGVAECMCEAKIKIPWALPTTEIVLSGTDLGVEQNSINSVTYEVIAPIEAAAEGNPETQLLVHGGYQSFECGNVGSGFPGCAYDFSCGSAVTDTNPLVRCRDCNDCKVKCAQACGESTTCMATAGQTCEGCCDAQTCGGYGGVSYDFWKCLIVPCYISDQESCSCQQACRGECEANTNFCNTIILLRIIAGIAVVIMLVVQALRYVMSDDPMDRQNAKEGIWYVIIGGVIIAIASALVGYFFMDGLLC